VDILDITETKATYLELADDLVQAAFRQATYQALEKNLKEFEFRGYVVTTKKAVKASKEMLALNTYH
jgi:hypothetical protein